MEKPKVSIIVPVYNVAQYLPECLDSLTQQTMTDIEIICINDGSTDHSWKILEGYATADNRVLVVEQQNMGLSGARNAALPYVTGDYLMYVDSDDWIDPETCAIAYQAICENQADVVMWAYAREYGNKTKRQSIFHQKEIVFEEDAVKTKLHRRIVGLVGEELRHPDKADSLVTAWGKLYKTSLIKDNGIEFVDTRLIGSEDALFNLHVFGYVKKAVYLNQFFYHYRKNNVTSLTKLYKKQLFSQCQLKYDMMEAYVVKENLGEEYGKALNNRIAMSIIELGLNILSASDLTRFQKIAETRKILQSERYRNAYQQLDTHYFPLHWKVFYRCAQLPFSIGLYFQLWCISRLIGA